MNSSCIITLTTDFGVSSPYVAAMKGVMLSINPHLQLVDISHSIPPQQIAIAALTLVDTALLFPAGTVHVAVVDPDVGTARPIIFAEIGSQPRAAAAVTPAENGSTAVITIGG